mgnify:CR=1 FL=1
MDNDRMYIDKLRQEVLSGRITYDDIVKRLTIAIETEYLKESPNIDFIESCEDFLWEIRAADEQKYVSVKDRYLKAIGQRAKVVVPHHSRNSSVMGFAKRIALICAALVLIICITQGTIHFEWFSQQSSFDEQQYIIQGHSVSIDLVMKSIAEHDQYATLKTDDWAEFTHFLGFTPTIIAPSAINATDTQYTAFIEPGAIIIIVQYSCSEESHVIYTVHHYLDMEEAYLLFEQDATGEHLSINSTEVYCTENLDRYSFTWLNSSTLYNLAGNLENKEFLKIIQELTGGTPHED